MRPSGLSRRPRAAMALGMLAASLVASLVVLGTAPSPARADHQPHEPEATRILITGDSITQGRPVGSESGGYSWRYFLWKRFEVGGQSEAVDFVGHKTGPAQAMTSAAQDPRRYADPDFDYDHAAVSDAELCHPTRLPGGRRIDDLVRTYRPDIIVSAWGINDLRRGTWARELLRCYDRWLRGARSANPDVDFVIARLPWAFAAHRNGATFNALLDDWAAARTTARSRIVLAEMAEPYGRGDVHDNVHPTQQGEEKIAGMVASSLAALGLQVDIDQPILPGNTFRAEPPARPALRLTRHGRFVTMRWSTRARTRAYVVRCDGASGIRLRRIGAQATHLRLRQPGRTACTVRAVNASGPSPWSAVRVVGRAP
ncbi:GDSL-type esterase/lipase family protein [Nocardioides caeni]|uniref:SGNH hydrolase-type esterase domain-containing protein n=1 Tax=Nocardioides caeni TaxID=574700 RepID=A0A4S8NNN4_9ACTN|nr:GDSL-type esterase/lipase family protein [Nocardioides caeni]THV18091.1 hypothetical protein E9934_00030 [Nocardioides caeni]